MTKQERTSRRTPHILIVMLILAAITLAAYWQTFRLDFIGYDDEQYVTANSYVRTGLTAASIKWAFTASHASNWHPLTWMSHMLDCRLFGMSPAGPHAVNLLLHIANTLLLLYVLDRMTGSLWKSAFVAALFALHPMHVESVAWVAERKDVLSTFFMLLTVCAYVGYAGRPRPGRYLAVMFLFGLGLLAKPTLVTLPFVLLLLDYWPLGRFSQGKSNQGVPFAKLLLEKAPLLVMSVASSAVTFWAQQSGGAVATLADRFALPIRISNAFVAYVSYIAKMVWPHKMAIFYPHPGDGIPEWQIAGSVVVLLCITVLALGRARKAPYLAVGWLWYLGTLVPMIGLVQVGKAAMADRYTYISYTGLFIILAWGLPTILSSRATKLLAAGATIVLLMLGAVTQAQVGRWQNEMTVFQHALNVARDNDTAHIHVGNCLFREGKTLDAMRHYEEALRINPRSDRAHNNMGNALSRLGRVEEAIEEYRTALELRDNPVAHYNLARQLAALGSLDEAVEHFELALKTRPDYPDARLNLAAVLERQGKTDQAKAQLKETIRIAPYVAEAYFGLGGLLAREDDLDGAIEQYTHALRARPDYPEAHHSLGNAYVRKGMLDEAIAEYGEAIKDRPGYADAHFNMGVAFDSKNDIPLAMQEYRSAIAAKPDHGQAHANLAVDLYISGMYADAWKALESAERYGCSPNPDFVKALSAKMPRPK